MVQFKITSETKYMLPTCWKTFHITGHKVEIITRILEEYDFTTYELNIWNSYGSTSFNFSIVPVDDIPKSNKLKMYLQQRIVPIDVEHEPTTDAEDRNDTSDLSPNHSRIHESINNHQYLSSNDAIQQNLGETGIDSLSLQDLEVDQGHMRPLENQLAKDVSPIYKYNLMMILKNVFEAQAVVLHRGQVDTHTNITCNKCLQEEHKSFECPNDWVCRTCGGSGHKASYCTTCLNNWVCQTCGKSGHTAKYCNADSDTSSDDSQSDSELDSDISSHPESSQNEKPKTNQAADADNQTQTLSFTFNKQPSNDVDKHVVNNHDDQSNQSEKTAKGHVKKAKRAKKKEKKTNNILIMISRTSNVS
ncbi:CNBP [Mytilus coruscus]|uniref:CNBP n=1 Tax=Mytilus coruscus TaxID=42192 RepID=A0A6J8BS47_MYTCO|nr:CNBP [Mytilus coruscus]